MMTISDTRKQQNPPVGKSKIKYMSLKRTHSANLGKFLGRAENN